MTDADAAVEILRRAAEDRSAHQHLGARVDAARTLVDARRAERDELQERLRVEEADVRRIEGISAARLWATLRGDAPEQAARERASATPRRSPSPAPRHVSRRRARSSVG